MKKTRSKQRSPLIVPKLALEEEKPVRIKFTFSVKVPAHKTVTNKPLVRVICLNLDSMEFIDLGLPRAIFDRLYNPQIFGRSYVGRSFELTRHARRAGARQCTYSVFEIES